MRKYLVEKTADGEKGLEGKTDEEIAKLYDTLKATETAAPVFKIDDVKTPDDMPIPDDMKAEITTFANENKLNKEQMQKLMDMGVKTQTKNLEFWDKTKLEWRKQSENDPDIGGQKFEDSVRLANKMVRDFAGGEKALEELQDDLQLLGLGNKRSFIKLMVNMGQHFTNAKLPGGGGGGEGERKSPEKILYPNMA